MSDITLSRAVRSNLLSLQNTASMMETTQGRLASGKKVNSALDNPTNFFTASSLNSRAGDMNALLDGMANGIQTLQAADNGLTAITKTLESMQSTLRQARQDKSFQTSSLSIDTGAVGTAALKNLSFSGGSISSTTQIALNSLDDAGEVSAVAGGTYTAPAAGSTAAIAFAADWEDPAAVTATATGAFTAVASGETISFDVNGETVTLDDTTGADIDTAIASIQSQLDTALGDGTAGSSGLTVGKNGGGTNLTIEAAGGTGVAITNVVDATDPTDGAIGFAADGSDDAAADLGTAATNLAFDVDVDGTEYNVTITAGSTAAEALQQINDALDGSGLEAVDDGNGGFTIQESTATGAEITIDGTDAATLFGSASSTDQGVAGGTYEFTINGQDISIAAGTALADAVSAINTQLGADSDFEAVSASGGITIREKVASGATITIAGDDAATVFGATLEDTGVAATEGGVKTVDQLVEAINTNATLMGSVRASNDNGKLRIENQSTQVLDITGFNATTAKIDGGAGTTEIKGNTVRAGLADQFNELRDQLDKLADDASFNGINLLRGDNLNITFNETGNSQINIRTKAGETINSQNLGIQTTIEAADLDSDSAIDGFLSEIKGAINKVRAQASSFGSNLSIVENRQAFTKNMINTLETGAANLTLADSNEEAANLLALQTRQQLSSTALSMASQADQAVLRLF